MLDLFLIKKPHITEKSVTLGNINQYSFVVSKNATAPEIKKAMKKIYDVDAIKVNVLNVKEKMGRYGRTQTVKRPGYKKAIVTIKAGQTLDILPK